MKQNYTLIKQVFFCLMTLVAFSLDVSANGSTSSSENTSFLTAESSLECNTSPVIVCPQNYYGCPTSNYNQLNTGHATATPGEAGCPTPIITHTDEVMSQGPCNGAVVVKRIWRADYPNASNPWLFADCTQIILLEDNDDPVFTHVPSNVTVSMGANCTAVATWNPANATDNCGAPTITYSHVSGTTFSSGNTTVTVTATDICGNSVSSSFVVTVSGNCCNTPPTIHCPANVAMCPSGGISPSSTGTATATTGCSSVSVTYQDLLVQLSNCPNGGIYERTWTATLASNTNITSTCVQRIAKDDNIRPTVTSCPSSVVVTHANNTVNWTPPTFTDNCSSVTTTCSHQPNTTFGVGNTVVTCTGKDACGNAATCSFTVTVTSPSCNSNPVISCPSTYTACPGSNYTPQVIGYANASNAGAGCAQPNVSYEDFLEQTYSCNGKEIHRVWKATDPNNSNLTASCIQIIDLKDTQAPTLSTCPPNINVATANTAITWLDPTATDNCGTASVSCHPSSGSVFANGNTVVTCTATDQCGNSSQCTFTVSVSTPACSTNPTIQCPSTYTACPGANTNPQHTGLPTTNNTGSHCAQPSVTYEDFLEQTYACNGKEIHRVWTATDPGNSSLTASCTQIIDLKDTQAPSMSACPSDIHVSTPGTVTWSQPTATDNCGSASVTCHPASGSSFGTGNTVVTCTANDNCGNSTQCTFTVSVSAPSCGLTIECPDDIHVSCNDNSNVCWPLPTYETCCAACENDNIPGFLYMGEYNGHKYYCSNEPDYWSSAKKVCEELGGHLAVINNAEENAFCANFLENQNAWIGYSDKQREGSFEWCNGEETDYTNWYPGQPNNYNNAQDCVEMLSSGHWNDQYDNQKLEYICEIPCVTIDQIGGPLCGEIPGAGTHSIKYRVTDLCGNVEECSFNVISDAGMTMQCIDDVTISCPATATCVKASWNKPEVNTCCNNCNGSGGNIAGFVYMGSYGGSHYYCSTFDATWPQAQAYCAQNGGNLAIINNANENAYLANQLTIQSAYIGLSDAASEGTFKWVDGSGLSYTNWYAGQPNNYNNAQDYVELLNTGQWNDQYNSSALEFIMEISDCVNIHQTGGPANGSCLPIGTSTITYSATDGCGNHETCSFKITVVKDNPNNGTCNAYGQSASHAWIKKVELSNLLNTSGNNGGYKDFTHLCATVKEGYSYNMALMPGFPGSPSTVYWKVYIDWNRDGDYLDSYEYIANGSGSGQISGQIPIPHGVPHGSTTLRVVMRKGAPPSGPCTPFSYGEVEDYCITVHPGTQGLISDTGETVLENAKRDVVSFAEVEVASRDHESIDKAVQSVNVEVFPNPASEVMNVGVTGDRIENIEMYTVTGKKVKTIGGTDYTDISVRDLENGVYLIRVNLVDGDTVVKRILVQK